MVLWRPWGVISDGLQVDELMQLRPWVVTSDGLQVHELM